MKEEEAENCRRMRDRRQGSGGGMRAEKERREIEEEKKKKKERRKYGKTKNRRGRRWRKSAQLKLNPSYPGLTTLYYELNCLLVTLPKWPSAAHGTPN